MDQKRINEFMQNKADYGEVPADYVLTEDQKRLAALAMGINAAVVQFILEGFIPIDEQIHFMGHLHDFTNRIYNGEALKMPSTTQTLNINAKSGTLFFEAAEDALKNGTENFHKLRELGAKLAEAAKQDNVENSTMEQQNVKPTLH